MDITDLFHLSKELQQNPFAANILPTSPTTEGCEPTACGTSAGRTFSYSPIWQCKDGNPPLCELLPFVRLEVGETYSRKEELEGDGKIDKMQWWCTGWYVGGDCLPGSGRPETCHVVLVRPRFIL